MKLLTLAAATLATLFAAKAAVAQTAVYDTITNATTAWYTQLGCALPPPQLGSNFLAGDNFITNPVPTCICQVEVVFVALNPGTYNVDLTFYDDRCFTTLVSTASGPITVGAAGVYIVTFNLTPSICITGDVATVPPLFFAGNGGAAMSVHTDSDDFVTAFDNSATTVGVDSDGFSLDTDCSGTLTPCPPGTEWYTFDQTWTNANMLFALYTNCPPSPEKAKGPSVAQSVSVRQIDLPVKRAPKRMSLTDILPKLFR